MKQLILILGLAVCVTANTVAQNVTKKDSYPYWTLSKEVQRFQFKDVEYTPSVIATGNMLFTSSKGVQRISDKGQVTEKAGRVAFTGTPSWVISKGVARMQYERVNNKR
jgi:hypothetical protein